MKTGLKDSAGNCLVCGKPWIAKPSHGHGLAYFRWLAQHIHTIDAWIKARREP